MCLGYARIKLKPIFLWLQKHSGLFTENTPCRILASRLSSLRISLAITQIFAHNIPEIFGSYTLTWGWYHTQTHTQTYTQRHTCINIRDPKGYESLPKVQDKSNQKCIDARTTCGDDHNNTLRRDTIGYKQ